MKLMNKVKIINWHYFWNETINIEPIVFLTGVNASGKSTLIDAIQVVLLGDTSGRYFNKAAMEKSNRTLRGYLRGELGDSLEGGFHYLRNGRFTSYIALEFFDDVKQEHFVLGIVFDTFEDGGEEHRFFILDAKMPDNEFIDGDLPMEYKDLVKYLLANYPNKYRFFDSNRQYQDALKRQLGNLKDKYFSLLKKAVSFTPITDITTFITEYVTESQKNIEILPMQENILQYKKLEDEAQVMKYKVDRLADIRKTFEIYQGHSDTLKLFEYVLEKATHQNDVNRLESYLSQINSYTKRIGDIESELADLDVNIAELNRRKTRLIQENATNDTYRITDELNEQKEQALINIKTLEFMNMEVRSNLETYLANFSNIANEIIVLLTSIDHQKMSKDSVYEVELLLESASAVLKENQNITTILSRDINEVAEHTLATWRQKLATFKQNTSGLSQTLAQIIRRAEDAEVLLKQQEIDLRSGGKPYERTLVQIRNELQNELSNKHGQKIEVTIFADLIDIKTPKWTNAIEGFLTAQRFNLFVDGRYFLEAYNILKGLLERYHFYGTSLIDIDRIIERRFEASSGSLAEEIMTDHLGARAYANFLIGRLIKCNTIQEARNSGNGITPETDLYRNFGFGRLNPRSYAQKFIGRQIEQGEINSKKAEIAAHAVMINHYKTLHSLISRANELEIVNTNEIITINSNIKRLHELPGLRENVKYLENELSKHDLTMFDGFQKRIALYDEDIKSVETQRLIIVEERGKLTTQISALKQEKIPETRAIIAERDQKIEQTFDVFFVAEKAEPFFQALLAEKKTPLDINSEYRSKFTTAQYLVTNVFSQLQKSRKEYVLDYRLSYDTNLTNNDVFDDELNDLLEVKLPEYQAKIHDAYQRAVKQFKDDFISKLRHAIETVEDQIMDLNVALSASTFGNDSYQFTVKPSAVYRVYYDMIKDDLLLKVGEDDGEFFDKYDEVMKDLFAQIVLAGHGDKNAAVLANVEKFTDYRNYLDFDLIVKDKAGNEQRLSRMLKKKSGGETQTPFYISVLASFAYLYRVHEPGELSNSARIIIFDEAFSKMDSGRIKESIRLLKKFGLQAIVSAPSDKVGDITPLVDQTLVVLRGKNRSHVQLFAKEENLTS